MKLPLPELYIPTEAGNNGPELRMPEIIKAPDLGRGEGNTNLDPLTKELVAIDGALVPFGRGTTQTDIAKIHGVKQEEVSYLSRGFDRSNIDERKEDEPIKESINQVKYRALDAATTKLMETLDLFDPSALNQKNLPDAAVKMASVMERLEGRGNVSSAPPVQFHIYAPRTRHEDQYEVIEVGE